jgi:hypothetical protein
VASLVFFLFMGCSHDPPIESSNNEPYKGTLGSVAIVSEATKTAEIGYLTPAKGFGEAFFRGVRGGSDAAIWGVMLTSGIVLYPVLNFSDQLPHEAQGYVLMPLFLALVTAAVTAAVPIGLEAGIEGAIRADSRETVEQSEAALKAAIIKLKVQETMRDHVLRVAQQETRRPIVSFPEQGLALPNDSGPVPRSQDPGPDTVLTTYVYFFGLETEDPARNRPMKLDMAVWTKLLQRSNGEALRKKVDERTFSCRSQARTFSEWAANRAQPLRDELDKCYHSLAREIVRELLGATSPSESYEPIAGGP